MSSLKRRNKEVKEGKKGRKIKEGKEPTFVGWNGQKTKTPQ